MKQYLVLLIFLKAFCSLNAQKHELDHYSISITTLHNNLSLGSFSSLFVKDYHPGFEVSTGYKWSEKQKHDWFQELQFGYSYQRWIQHSISLYTSAGYHYKFSKGFSSDISIGVGYLHAIPDSKIFKLRENGTYKKKFNWGRPQAMAALGIGIAKSFHSGKAIFLKYQQRVQTPFIKSYVPLLPANLLQAGIIIPFHKK